MSFEPNDMNTIHLGNYEEFFILYMDNELSDEQVKIVDEFLAANPDLKAELHILMGTKLPLEEFSFDKNDLLAENMKLSSIDEELLLYIDNELPADKKQKVEFELTSDKNYQVLHQVLLQTKLDTSEKIAYPNKEELYHRTERVIAFKIWMRVAAAVVIIAIGGVLYFKSPAPSSITGPQTTAGKTPLVQKVDSDRHEQSIPETTPAENSLNQVALNNSPGKKIKSNQSLDKQEKKNLVQQNETIVLNSQQPERRKIENVQLEEAIVRTEPKVSVNNPDVTSPLLTRNIIGTPENPKTAQGEPAIAKGSFKGFLRKATRMIEKRTGIDPTNENGELLIGAVAINLK